MHTRLLTAFAAVLPVMALGRVRRGRRCGPELHRVSAHRYRGQLDKAADRAIAHARRRPGAGTVPVVAVREVQRRAYWDFGLRSVPREYAARVLRERLDAAGHRLAVVGDPDTADGR
ncbi:hypothetical protein [Streptacidiphilus sp. P02-A3a]|uniref:hypothetical protein n=1 Tax=Streptacidiphilus sp. P02-A3a TaxID=2704468 RepID=UPI0015FC3B8A|nr:hypothetical protein [Streptacidiphilus sp. P02-A3a]QMU71196.1 hypothetical protein GXP74_26215 [Streptacidiphilus sp. P02-A3a]